MLKSEKVYSELKKVLDPELHINIVDLGLIYNVKTQKDGVVSILMTLTFPGCPLGAVIHKEINEKVGSLAEVKKVDLKITFDPPWDLSKVSEEAKLQLGIM
ncbi:MAG: iron-sulfur cluster assembly protein [Candidatus Woykebacteria bacterium]